MTGPYWPENPARTEIVIVLSVTPTVGAEDVARVDTVPPPAPLEPPPPAPPPDPVTDAEPVSPPDGRGSPGAGEAFVAFARTRAPLTTGWPCVNPSRGVFTEQDAAV